MAEKKGANCAYNVQARSIIANVIKYFDSEKEANKYKDKNTLISQATKRAAAATGVSVKTIIRIRKEIRLSGSTNEDGTVTLPKKRKKRPEYRNMVIDNIEKGSIRRFVNDFYFKKQKEPTIRNLLPQIKEELGFKWGRESLRKMLIELGFQRRCSKTNKKLLMERQDVVEWRKNYLTEMKKHRESGKNIVYVDETWIDSNLTFGKCCHGVEFGGITSEDVKHRLIVVSAGTRNGILPAATLIYTADNASGDYHGQMKSNIFEKWLTEHLIPNIQPNSVIILGSAPFDLDISDKSVTSTSNKKNMQELLLSRNVSFTNDLNKCELYKLVESSKPTEQSKIDLIIKNCGFIPVRLPPYHYDLNAVEFIWVQAKIKIKKEKGVDMNLAKLFDVTNAALNSVGEDFWLKACEQVLKVENEYWGMDDEIETGVDQFISTLGSGVICDDNDISDSSSLDGINECI